MELVPDTELATRTESQSLQDRLDARFDKIDWWLDRIDDRIWALHQTLHSSIQTFVIVQAATFVVVSGIFLGIALLA